MQESAPAAAPVPAETQAPSAPAPEDEGPVSPYVLDPSEAGPSEADPDAPDELTWTAAEFIAHQKSGSWYLVLAGITLVLMAATYFISQRYFPVLVVLICSMLFGYMAGRQPRQLPYTLSDTGIMIGQKFYPYADFTSFAVVDEGQISSIDFEPMKRFSPPLSVPFDVAQETPILGYLSNHLPLSPHKRTWIDNLMSRIHF
jgi:hypothetical protein